MSSSRSENTRFAPYGARGPGGSRGFGVPEISFPAKINRIPEEPTRSVSNFGGSMNWRKWITLALVASAISVLPNFGCPGTPGTDDDKDTEQNLVLGLAVAYANRPLDVIGAYNFYDGLNGTGKEGTYDITSTTRSQQYGSFSPYTGNIVMFDNNRRLFFEQVTTTGDANKGKFFWYRYTKHTDGKYYICGALWGAKTTLADSIEQANSYYSNTNYADPARLGTASYNPAFGGYWECLGSDCGCDDGPGGNAASFWSRLEPR